MLRWLAWSVVCVVAMMLSGSSHVPTMVVSPMHLDQVQRAWIRDYQVVRFGSLVGNDSTASSHGRELSTLGTAYLAFVEQRTGLHFIRVPVQSTVQAYALLRAGQIDLIEEVVVGCKTSRSETGTLLTVPYYKDSLVIAMRGDEPAIVDQDGLVGKSVAVHAEQPMEAECITKWIPRSRIVRFPTVRQQLDAVTDGEVDVAMGSEALLTPVVHASYASRLYLPGWIDGGDYTLHMAVRSDNPILLGIVNKALMSITAAEADRLYERWINDNGSVPPSWRSIVRAYGAEFGLFLAALAALLAALIFALRAYRAADGIARARARFVAVVTHEVRTPLNALLASIEMLRETPLHSDQRNLVAQAGKAGAMLLELANKVLDHDVIEKRRLPITVASCSPVQIAEDAVLSVAPLARQKALAMRFVVGDDVPDAVLLDEGRVRQVLVNLLGNAVKYTEQGHVELGLAVLRRVSAGERCELQFRVQDTGPGIPAEAQQGVFDPYVRLWGHRAALRQAGAGLGLAISKGLIGLMGGTITVRSVPGSGACFEVRIPVHIAARPWGPRLQGVLVHIDVSQPQLRNLIIRYLEREGGLCRGGIHSGEGSTQGLALRIIETTNAIEVLSTSGGADALGQAVDTDPLLPGALVDACVEATAVKGQHQDAASSPSPVPGEHANAVVLVVDDHPSNVEVIREQLNRLGYQSHAAFDVATALACFRRNRYAMVLLDCSLGDDDGYACATRMRTEEAQAERQRTPIIAYSAASGSEHALRCVDAGMDGILRKPVLLADLKRIMDMWLSDSIELVTLPEDTVSSLSAAEGSSTFWDATDRDIAALVAAVTEGDVERTRRIAHRAYGAAMVAGETYLAQVLRSVLDLAEGLHTDKGRIDELIAQLSAVSQHVRANR